MWDDFLLTDDRHRKSDLKKTSELTLKQNNHHFSTRVLWMCGIYCHTVLVFSFFSQFKCTVKCIDFTEYLNYVSYLL